MICKFFSIIFGFLIIGVVIFCALLLHRSENIDHRPNAKKGARKVIIDADPGADDAVAILLALASEELDVVAITCSFGNTDERNVETNVLKILTIANRSDVPVYVGAAKPILENFNASDYFFGVDGFGDFNFNANFTEDVDRSKHAFLAMIELSKKFSGTLSIINLGPLTNVAIASLTDPDFTQRIERFYVMGAKLYEPGGKKESNYNFRMDPVSSAIFLNSLTKIQSLIVPSNVIRKRKIPKDWRENVLGKQNSSTIEFLNKVERIELTKVDAWYPSDPVTVAVMIWPELITSSVQAHMSVITCDPLKGVTETDFNSTNGKAKNVEIVSDFDVDAFKDKLLTYLK